LAGFQAVATGKIAIPSQGDQAREKTLDAARVTKE
jgi:hypothetical protein